MMRFGMKAVALTLLLTLAGCSALSWFGGGDDEDRIRKIAVLPLGEFPRSGPGCTWCPEKQKPVAVSEDRAFLVTALFYEALTRHPSYEIVEHETLQRAMASGGPISETLAQVEGVDAVLETAALRVDERIGGIENPERAASVRLSAALLDATTGKVLWRGTAEETDTAGGAIGRRYMMLVRGEPKRWRSADAVAADVAKELVEKLIDAIDR